MSGHATLNLTGTDIQILSAMINAAATGMQQELNGQVPGAPTPNQERAKFLAEGIAVAQKWNQATQGAAAAVTPPPGQN